MRIDCGSGESSLRWILLCSSRPRSTQCILRTPTCCDVLERGCVIRCGGPGCFMSAQHDQRTWTWKFWRQRRSDQTAPNPNPPFRLSMTQLGHALHFFSISDSIPHPAADYPSVPKIKKKDTTWRTFRSNSARKSIANTATARTQCKYHLPMTELAIIASSSSRCFPSPGTGHMPNRASSSACVWTSSSLVWWGATSCASHSARRRQSCGGAIKSLPKGGSLQISMSRARKTDTTARCLYRGLGVSKAVNDGRTAGSLGACRGPDLLVPTRPTGSPPPRG